MDLEGIAKQAAAIDQLGNKLNDLAAQWTKEKRIKLLDEDFDRQLHNVDKFGVMLKHVRREGVGFAKIWPSYAKNLEKIKKLQADWRYQLQGVQEQLKNVNIHIKTRRALLAQELTLKNKLEKTTERSLKWEATKVAAIADGWALLGASLGVVGAAFTLMVGEAKAGYNVLDKLRASAGGLARQLGPATVDLQNFQQAATSLYFGTLGHLGYDLSELSADVGAYAAALGFSEVATKKQAAQSVILSKVLGISSGELGEAQRSFLLMNQSVNDSTELFSSLNAKAMVLKLPVAALAKNVLVGGKNMFSWFGPRAAPGLINSLGSIQKRFGILAQTVENFTKKTDSFDETIQSMARLNTAFGTHINALDVFAEDDPAKRFEIIRDQMLAQGKDMENLSRRERSLIQDSLGLTADEVNGLLKAGEAGEDYTEVLKKLNQEEEKKIKNQRITQTVIGRLSTTIYNFQRFWDSIHLASMNLINPLLEGLGLGKDFSNMGQVMGNIETRVKSFFKTIGENQTFKDNMFQLGKMIGDFFGKIWEFLNDPNMTKRISGWVTQFGELLSIVSKAVYLIGSLMPDSPEQAAQKQQDKQNTMDSYWYQNRDKGLAKFLNALGVIDTSRGAPSQKMIIPVKPQATNVTPNSPFSGATPNSSKVQNNAGFVLPSVTGQQPSIWNGAVNVYIDGQAVLDKTYSTSFNNNPGG